MTVSGGILLNPQVRGFSLFRDAAGEFSVDLLCFGFISQRVGFATMSAAYAWALTEIVRLRPSRADAA